MNMELSNYKHNENINIRFTHVSVSLVFFTRVPSVDYFDLNTELSGQNDDLTQCHQQKWLSWTMNTIIILSETLNKTLKLVDLTYKEKGVNKIITRPCGVRILADWCISKLRFPKLGTIKMIGVLSQAWCSFLAIRELCLPSTRETINALPGAVQGN